MRLVCRRPNLASLSRSPFFLSLFAFIHFISYRRGSGRQDRAEEESQPPVAV